MKRDEIRISASTTRENETSRRLFAAAWIISIAGLFRLGTALHYGRACRQKTSLSSSAIDPVRGSPRRVAAQRRNYFWPCGSISSGAGTCTCVYVCDGIRVANWVIRRRYPLPPPPTPRTPIIVCKRCNRRLLRARSRRRRRRRGAMCRCYILWRATIALISRHR